MFNELRKMVYFWPSSSSGVLLYELNKVSEVVKTNFDEVVPLQLRVQLRSKLLPPSLVHNLNFASCDDNESLE